MKIRMKFSKFGNMRFIGHLDTMRYFQKVMRRADIDIAYSTGFSPHQIMSFAAPLGVGLISEGEYLDIEVNSTDSTEESLRRLNLAMVDGYQVNDYRRLPDDAKTAMSIVSAASYTLTYRKGYEANLNFARFRQAIADFYENRETIPVIKKTKKSEKEIDLKKLIYDFSVSENTDGKIMFSMLICTGSTDNIKPELVMEHFYSFLGLELQQFTFQVTRHEVYTGSVETGFTALIDMGEIIP